MTLEVRKSSSSLGALTMEFSFLGRVRKIRLSPSRALNPLFEAVVNSIDSIRQSRISNGRIHIVIERVDDPQARLYVDSDTRPIENFIITDNGIGFTEKNFKSFNTSDFTYKPGALGIGRLLWLLAFDRINVESFYAENGENYRRTFDFKFTEKGVENDKLEGTTEKKQETVVKLLGFKPKYREESEKRLDTIARRLLEHCLYYLMQSTCPSIIVSNQNDAEGIVINDLYAQQMKGKTGATKTFKVGDASFEITNLQLYEGPERKHWIYYCANDRPVRHLDLSKKITDVGNIPILDDQRASFRYAAYVSGDYLTSRVSQERTSFDISESGNEDKLPTSSEDISWIEIDNAAAEEARTFLKSYLEPVAQKKIERITKYIQHQAPQYRPIFRYRKSALDSVRHDATDAEMDNQLHKIMVDIERELKAKTREVLNKQPDDVTDLETYREKYNALVEAVNDVSMSKLAQHVIHRKVILELLQSFLKLRKDQTYERESVIHQTVFPMKKTSDDVLYEQQNLWIIDERLSFHKFLASDLALSTYKVLKTKDGRRPDITIFVGESSAPFDSVVVIEFKRPMRDDYTSEDPIRKLYEIAKTIRDGEALDDEGRTIKVHSATRIYCYFICDIVADQIKDHADVHRLVQAPDGLGYFGYHEPYQTYMEIIDYDKLVSDAKKRNLILFERLDLI